MAMATVEQRVVYVDGVRTVYRCVDGDGPPTVFLHGNPTHSEDWVPFMERVDGPAVAPDLPGWGFSERPDRDHFDYSMFGLSDFVDRFLDELGIDQHSLVVHDWGCLGLIGAQRHPQRLRRLVVINCVPLLPGFRWHWVGRYLWRVPGVGELANATATRASLRLLSFQGTPRPGPLPARFTDLVWSAWGGRTRPEMLALYRSADPERLAAAGDRLERIDCPALVLWGVDDPYIPVRFGRDYAGVLPQAELVELERAGHWPWIDRPDAVDRVCGFLSRQ